LERLEIDQERREKRERQQYKHQRDRAILVLTENARERQKREDMEFLENKLKERKEFLISEIKRYRKDPHNFDRNNSEIFGTKKGLTEEERDFDYKILQKREDELIQKNINTNMSCIPSHGRRYGRRSPWPVAREMLPRACKEESDGRHGSWKYGGCYGANWP